MGLVDLSAPIRPDPPQLPDVLRTDVTYVACFPLRLAGGSAAPARVVAIV